MPAFELNVAAPFRLVQALLPNLRRADNPLVINVSSRLASIAAQARGDYADLKSSYAYRVSKAAQNMLTVAIATECQGWLRCWAVHPGALLTGMALADAAKPPEQAACELRQLVETPDERSTS